MRIEPISVSELNKYMKDKVAEDEYLKSVFVQFANILHRVIQFQMYFDVFC